MSYLIAVPEILDSAATDLASIAGTLNAANASAAVQTTGIVAAAQDEVSAAIAALFSERAQAYQAVSAQAAAYHQQFMHALTAGAGVYAGAEAANASHLGQLLATISAGTGANGLLAGPGATSAENVALIMGGSGEPIPTPDFIATNFNLFIKPFFQNFTPQALFTPEGNYALYTGVKSLTLDMSEAQGVQILDSAVTQQIAAGNVVVVKGESQSSTISSMVMPLLAAQGVPDTKVSFVLTGDPNAPNGGLFERLDGLSIPALGITFNGATPSDLYPTTIWTQEYDGFADVPQYPINLLSDLNSLAGIYYVHPTYENLTPTQIGSAIPLPTQGPTMTTYYMIPTQNLPLLDPLRSIPVVGNPLRSIPVVGNPLADLLQPDLKVLVNLGYGDPDYGWSQGPANVPTQFGLFPSLSDVEKVPPLLALGTQQGITDFMHDVSAEFSSAGSLTPSLSSLTIPSLGPPSGPSATMLASPANLLSALSPVSVADNVYNAVNSLSDAASDAYSTLLPTADVANGLLTSLPAYDLTLFAAGLQSGNLLDAIGQPIATDTYLIPLAGAFEAFAVIGQAETVVSDLAPLIP
jgi:PE-PPE domain/PE family